MNTSLEAVSRKVKSILIGHSYGWDINISACAGVVDIRIMANKESRTWLDVDLFRFFNEDSEVLKDMDRFARFAECNHQKTNIGQMVQDLIHGQPGQAHNV